MTTSTDLTTFKIAKGTKAQIVAAYNNGDIGDTDFAIATDEQFLTTDNIATSVSASSTDNEVVSAKLFYDTCGDIETLINNL